MLKRKLIFLVFIFFLLSSPFLLKLETTEYQDEELKAKLLKSSEKGEADVVAALVEAGVNPNNCRDYFKRTPLILASSSGHINVVKILIRAGADKNAQDSMGRTALMHAQIHDFPNYVETVKFLLESGADVNIKDNEGNTALAYNSAHARYVLWILQRDYDINTPDARRYFLGVCSTPKYVGQRSINMSINILKEFLKKNIDVNIREDSSKMTPIMKAAKGGITEMVRLLIEKGADINAKDKYNRTALYYAATNGHVEIVKILKER